MSGTIARIFSENGYGFISGDDGHRYFFHCKELKDGLLFENLREGQRLTFEPDQNERGLRAREVRLE